ncbi:uncharacterized protein MAL13P1.304-like [Daktulosphaira vitifoliae]|uniref:uncharacterized protein MAL13P1.304-like n=1 Tax=Daktulosphaira vitifoliae TaxID=58002 RepID=UPI0021A9DD22|nr:uncharacterized protein MAL13P1.304-like [Daktulosphaira vitifoliae]
MDPEKSKILNKIIPLFPSLSNQNSSISSEVNELYYSDSEGSKLHIMPQYNSFLSNSNLKHFQSKDLLATSSPITNKISLKTNKLNYKSFHTTNNDYLSFSINSNIKNISSSKSPKKNSKLFVQNNKCSLSTISLVPSMSQENIIQNNLQPSLCQVIKKNPQIEHFTQLKNCNVSDDLSKCNLIKTLDDIKINKLGNEICHKEACITEPKRNFEGILNKIFELPDNISKEDLANISGYNDLYSALSNTININLEQKQYSTSAFSVNSDVPHNISTESSNYFHLAKNLKQEAISCSKFKTLNYDIMDENECAELIQYEIDLKMFSSNIIPYMNSLKFDILFLKNKQNFIPSKKVLRGVACTNDTLKSIKNCLSLYSLDNNNIDTDFVNNTFLDAVKSTSDNTNIFELNDISNKIKYVEKLKEQLKFYFGFEMSNNHSKITINTPDELSKHSTEILNCSSQVSSILMRNSNNKEELQILQNNSIEAKDLSYLLPVNYDNISNQSPELPSKENSILIEFDRVNINDNQSLSTVKNSSSNNVSKRKISFLSNDENENKKRYSLRSFPKQTNRFIEEIKTITIKKRKKKFKNKDKLIIIKGIGKNQKLIHYRAYSTLNQKDINIKINNKNANNSLDIINKNSKLCCCGIYKSQIPCSWSKQLHAEIHDNLQKILCKDISLKNANQVSINGSIYFIVKICNSNLNDKNIIKTVSNVRQFISLELDNTKKKRTFSKSNYAIYLAVHPNLTVVGYLEVEKLTKACTLINGKFTNDLVSVKFGVTKLWVMVSFRRNGIATKLLQQFQKDEQLNLKDIAFTYDGLNGLNFIKKYFSNESIQVY